MQDSRTHQVLITSLALQLELLNLWQGNALDERDKGLKERDGSSRFASKASLAG